MQKTDRFQSGIFRRLVFIYMMQALALSVTGIVDCAFAGQFFGAEALAGMKLAMPVYAVLELFSGTLCSGLSIQITKSLADGKRERADQVFTWACIFTVGISALFALSGALFPSFLTAVFSGNTSDPVLLSQTRDYLMPVLFGAFPILGYNILSSMIVLESEKGPAVFSTAVSILVIDAAGDIIAVKQDAGIFGISAASIAAYFCAFLITAVLFFNKNTLFRLRLSGPGSGAFRDVIVSGLPAAVRSLCAALCPVIINRLMLFYGSSFGLAALSIQDAFHYLPLAFCIGLSSSVVLLTGMYAAEQDREGIRQVRMNILRFSFGAGVLTAVILAVLAPFILDLFTRDPQLKQLGVPALRWYLLGFPFVGINMSAVAYLQGMGKGRMSGICIFLNQLILPAAAAWLMGRFLGITGIYASFAVCEMIFTLGTVIFEALRRNNSGRGEYGTENWDTILAEVRIKPETEDQVAAASEEIIRLCSRYEVDRKQALHTGLCLEELGVNSIKHGFQAGRPNYLEIRFLIREQWLILRLRDNCRYYDLTEQYRLLNPENRLSHIGLRLVFAAADNVEYSHALNLNNICIRMAKKQADKKSVSG